MIYIDDVGTIGRNFHQYLYWKFFARDVLGHSEWVINTSNDQVPAQDTILWGSVVDTRTL